MSSIGTRKALDIDWIERWARIVNDDRILRVTGRFFTNRLLLGVDEVEFLLEIQEGQIKRIHNGLTPNNFGFDFGLKASTSTWLKFCQKVPPPMFNDIWAMAHPLHRNMTIEGDTMPFWQNVRALTRMLALMREV